MVASTARLQQKMQFTKFTDFGQREFYAGMNRYNRAELGAPPTYHVIARMRFQREALLARGVAVHQIRQEVFGSSLLQHLQ
jgi:hypothetical protein